MACYSEVRLRLQAPCLTLTSQRRGHAAVPSALHCDDYQGRAASSHDTRCGAGHRLPDRPLSAAEGEHFFASHQRRRSKSDSRALGRDHCSNSVQPSGAGQDAAAVTSQPGRQWSGCHCPKRGRTAGSPRPLERNRAFGGKLATKIQM